MAENIKDGPWAPFRVKAFCWLWLGALAVNLALWMQNVGAAWMMLTLTTSPLMVALVQTAVSLPSFFFGLPGGVFADIFNRRSYLMVTQAGMLLAALVLVACAWFGLITPVLLLALTFAFGIGFALMGPAWYSAQAESVPRLLMPSALALSSVSYSSARAVGPALAGGVVAVSGIVSVFAICALLLFASLLVICFMRSPVRDSSLPPETLLAGLRGAVRYTRYSQVMRWQILRTTVFVAAGSGMWALLPLVASESGGDAGRYGLLLGSIGAGTMFGALVLPAMRARLEVNRLITVACALFAVGGGVVAAFDNILVLCTALFFAGIGWMCVGTTNLVAIQTVVPSWIRARAVAIYMLVFQGALAIGGAAWGVLASYISLSETLGLASLVVLASVLVMWRYPIRLGEEADVMPSDVELPGYIAEPDAQQEGPVAVQVSYQVDAASKDEFLALVSKLGIKRRRNGASFWRLYREMEQPLHYQERFMVDSWSDYVRQQSRLTVADLNLERRVRALHVGEQPPRVVHFIGEKTIR